MQYLDNLYKMLLGPFEFEKYSRKHPIQTHTLMNHKVKEHFLKKAMLF